MRTKKGFFKIYILEWYFHKYFEIHDGRWKSRITLYIKYQDQEPSLNNMELAFLTSNETGLVIV